MSAQPIVFGILEETPETKRSKVPEPKRSPRQSSLQDLQPADLIVADLLAGETPLWRMESPTPVGVDLVGQDLVTQLFPQVFSQPRSARSLGEIFGTESSPVISEIDALLAGSEDEVVPTGYAHERARSIIEAAYGEINRRRFKKHWGVPKIFPKPLVTTDDVGGIRVSWCTENKQVRANFGARPEPELRSYVYFESALEHGVDQLDAQHLAGRLAWLTGR
jgi:hypothetical protein